MLRSYLHLVEALPDLIYPSPTLELDATYVPIRRGAPNNLQYLASAIHPLGPIYVLPSAAREDWLCVPDFCQLLDYRDYASATPRPNNQLTPLDKAVSIAASWDLGLKRSAAVAHAHISGYESVLMLDEDIFVPPQLLFHAGNALGRFDIVSIIPTHWPDRSLFGDLLAATQIRSTNFLTGSCLFLRIDETSLAFPNVYNEDWFHLLARIERGARIAYAHGSIQEPKAPPSIETIFFQEAHDFIAETAATARLETRDLLDPLVWFHLHRWRGSLIDQAVQRAQRWRDQRLLHLARAIKRAHTLTEPLSCQEEWVAIQRSLDSSLGGPKAERPTISAGSPRSGICTTLL